MSGGFFDYRDVGMLTIAESIEHELHKDPHGKVIPRELRPHFEDAVFLLNVARAYARRVDYFLSGDDGPRSFLERLGSDLDVADRAFGRGNHVRPSVLAAIDRGPVPNIPRPTLRGEAATPATTPPASTPTPTPTPEDPA